MEHLRRKQGSQIGLSEVCPKLSQKGFPCSGGRKRQCAVRVLSVGEKVECKAVTFGSSHDRAMKPITDAITSAFNGYLPSIGSWEETLPQRFRIVRMRRLTPMKVCDRVTMS